MPLPRSLQPLAALAAVAILASAAPVAAQEPVPPAPPPPPVESGMGGEVEARPDEVPATAPEGDPATAPEGDSATAPEGDVDTTLNDALLLSASALSLALSPTSIALLNDDMSFKDALQVSVAGSFGVFCATAGTTLAVAGGAFMVLSILWALLDEDGAGEMLLVGALMGGVGVGLFLLSPLVFSLAADVDGGYGDSTGEIAVVSTTSTLAASLATIVGYYALDGLEAEGWVKVVAIASFAFLMANVTYGATRALMFEEPAAAMAPLLPPIRF